MFTTLNFLKWEDYKHFTEELSDNWAFRGQLHTHWELRNAIERTDFIKRHNGIEADFVQEFKRGARNYLAKDETPGHLIEWLALMQHHGAPTRLLDFSKSPFVAAFFAFEQCDMRPEKNI
ncbi:MAG TPA: FRG domain-containing protein, partial [Chitinophagaceae bacterium]|nr:FRG domain-containing protein [Chitinophagaceae bacterium]